MFSNINHKLGIFADNQWSFLLRAESKKTLLRRYLLDLKDWYQPLFGILYDFILNESSNVLETWGTFNESTMPQHLNPFLILTAR